MVVSSDLSAAFSRMIRPRINFMLRKNLDGTVSISVMSSNPYKRFGTIKVRGHDVASVFDEVASTLDEIDGVQKPDA